MECDESISKTHCGYCGDQLTLIEDVGWLCLNINCDMLDGYLFSDNDDWDS